MTTEVLFELRLTEESDVFTARQLGRVRAVALGMDRLDAIRVATAISELGRDVVATGGVAHASGSNRPTSSASTSSASRAPPDGRRGRSRGAAGRRGHAHGAAGRRRRHPVQAVRRLVDRSVDRLQQVRTRLAALSSQNPTDELREQNRELIATLDEVRAQKSALEVVNHELEETNRGVMALQRALGGTGTDQPGRGRPLRRDRRQERAAPRGERGQEQVPSASATSCVRRPTRSSVSADCRRSRRRRLAHERAGRAGGLRPASAQDLLSLVNELPDLAKAESGRLDAVVDDVDVALFEELRGTTELLLRPGVALEVRPVGLRP